MKKLTVILLVLCSLFLNGCETQKGTEDNNSRSTTKVQSEKQEYRAVWLSYLELNYSNSSENAFKADIDAKFDNIKDAGFNTVVLHVRANCDAAYPSMYFPFSAAYSGKQGVDPGYDPLEYMVSAAKERGLKTEAWINPYRVSSSSNDIALLSENNPARLWLEDDDESNDKNVILWDKGIYLNPASEDVRNLIVDGIEELLQNYDINGIQFDDYFYPTADPDFDKSSFEEYKASSPTHLPLQEWRRTNVSLLLSECYKLVHKYENKTFGISPTAAISKDKTDKNYAEYFADIYSWMSTKGYIDYIAPQLYFGYNYGDDTFKFSNLLNAWNDTERLDEIKLYIGLAAYKIGQEDAGSREWIETHSLLARQISDLRLKNTDGYLIYSYSGLFSESPKNKKELEAIKELN